MTKTCQCGKRSYRSEKIAMEVIVKVNTNKGFNLKRAYPCPEGNGWHLTSQKAQKYKRYVHTALVKEHRKTLSFESKLNYLKKFMDVWINVRVHKARQRGAKRVPLPVFDKFLDKKISNKLRDSIKQLKKGNK